MGRPAPGPAAVRLRRSAATAGAVAGELRAAVLEPPAAWPPSPETWRGRKAGRGATRRPGRPGIQCARRNAGTGTRWSWAGQLQARFRAPRAAAESGEPAGPLSGTPAGPAASGMAEAQPVRGGFPEAEIDPGRAPDRWLGRPGRPGPIRATRVQPAATDAPVAPAPAPVATAVVAGAPTQNVLAPSYGFRKTRPLSGCRDRLRTEATKRRQPGRRWYRLAFKTRLLPGFAAA